MKTVSENIKENTDWEIFGTNVASFAYSTGMSMAESVMLQAMFGKGSSIVMGLNSAASTANDIVERGGSANQAMWGGFTAGAAEMIFEKISLESLFENVLNGDGKAIVKILTQAGVEFSEEAATEVSNIITDAVIMKDNSNYDRNVQAYIANGLSQEDAEKQAFYDLIGQVAEAGAAGALSGGVMGAGGAVISKATEDTRIGKTILEKDGALETLTVSAVTTANETTGEASKAIFAALDAVKGEKSAKNVGKLYKAVATAQKSMMAQQNKDGKTATDSKTSAASNEVDSFTAADQDYDTALFDYILAKNDPNISAEQMKVIEDNLAKANERLNTEYRNKTNREAQKIDTELNQSDSNISAEIENNSATADSGISINSNGIRAADITGVTRDSEGKVTGVKVGNEQIGIEDEGVSFSADAAELLGVMPEGISSDEVVSDYLSKYDGSVSAEYYAKVYSVMYDYGSRNLPVKAAMEIYSEADVPASTRYGAWELGRKATVAEAKAAQAEAIRNSKGNIQKRGTVDASGVTKRLNNRQRNSVEVLKKLAQVTGVNFILYDSKIVDGEFAGENGRFENNTIYIDINAGLNTVESKQTKNAIIGTASHELTHFIKEWSPEKYEALETFLLEEYSKYRDVNAAIKNKQKALGLKREAVAREELVAECCESMLTDAEGIRKLAERDMGIAEKIVHWLDDYIGKLKKAVKDMELYSAEAKFLQQSSTEMSKIRDLWYDALADAVDTFNGRKSSDVSNNADVVADKGKNKNTSTADGEVRYSKRGVNKDGIEVYETSDAIKQLSYDERKRVFLELMNNEYRGRTAKFIRNGHTYYALFEDADVRKNIYGDRRSDEKGWKAKINVGAEGEIFELVENSQYNGSKTESGKTTKAHSKVSYWDYFVKTVQIDNRMYDLVANIRKKNDDNYVYSIQLNENKKTKASPPLILQKKVLNRVLNASNSKISQNASDVNTSQTNSSENLSTDTDSRSSKRFREETIGETEIKAENEKLKGDIAKLKDLIKLQRTLTHGRLFTNDSVKHAAERIMRNAGIHKDKAALIEELHAYYTSIASAENLDWDTVYSGAAEIASRWYYDNYKAPVNEDNVALKNLIRSQSIKLSDTQKQEAANIYGSFDDFRKKNYGRLRLSENGVPLENVIAEWADTYPQHFDFDTSEGDALRQLDDAIKEAYSSDSRIALDEFEQEQAVRDIAMNIYDEYWNISTLRTWADRKDSEIKLMRAAHNNRMSELRKTRDETISDLKKHYIERYNALREKKNAQLEEQAQHYRDKISEGVENRGKKAGLERAERLTKDLVTMLTKPTDKKHVPDGLAEPLSRFLDSLDFNPILNYRKDGAPANEKTVALKTEKWKRAFSDVKSFIENHSSDSTVDLDSDTAVMIEEFLSQVEGLNIYELSSGQLKVYEVKRYLVFCRYQCEEPFRCCEWRLAALCNEVDIRLQQR